MIIGIIGYGRFGRLLHKHLKKNSRIKIYKKETNKDSLKNCDLVILAVPINAILEVVLEIKDKIDKNTVVMDVCSVKVKPARIMKKYLKDNIIAAHPLFGPDSAKRGFKDHKMVLCPLSITDKNFNKIKKIFTKLGIEIILSTPKQHDIMMAKSQALVHFIGRGLKDIKPQTIATPDYYNLLTMMDKVTNDTWELFYDMQNLNPYADKERQKFIKNILSLENKIKEKNAKIK